MYKRLERYVNENNLVNAEQIGFKRGARSSDNILTIKTLGNKYAGDQKGKNYMLALSTIPKTFRPKRKWQLFRPLKEHIEETQMCSEDK